MIPQAKLILIIKHQIKHLTLLLDELQEQPPTIATPVDDHNAGDVMEHAMRDPGFLAFLERQRGEVQR